MLPMRPMSSVYLDIVTRVGFGSALRKSWTAETSVSISRLVLMWWGSSAESQVNPAWCTCRRGDEEDQRMEQQKEEGDNVVMLPLHTSCCGLFQKGVSDGRKKKISFVLPGIWHKSFFFYKGIAIGYYTEAHCCHPRKEKKKKNGAQFHVITWNVNSVLNFIDNISTLFLKFQLSSRFYSQNFNFILRMSTKITTFQL